MKVPKQLASRDGAHGPVSEREPCRGPAATMTGSRRSRPAPNAPATLWLLALLLATTFCMVNSDNSTSSTTSTTTTTTWTMSTSSATSTTSSATTVSSTTSSATTVSSTTSSFTATSTNASQALIPAVQGGFVVQCSDPEAFISDPRSWSTLRGVISDTAAVPEENVTLAMSIAGRRLAADVERRLAGDVNVDYYIWTSDVSGVLATLSNTTQEDLDQAVIDAVRETFGDWYLGARVISVTAPTTTMITLAEKTAQDQVMMEALVTTTSTVMPLVEADPAPDSLTLAEEVGLVILAFLVLGCCAAAVWFYRSRPRPPAPMENNDAPACEEPVEEVVDVTI